ncbi:hypothetical protein P8C59_006750 [Phyllachora maydis]|uniref:Rad60/SUMO-like domain-containing protein n=1 Tax=Phyllachora maydis TaxID=1825666 RepID=A0AAD9MFU8_9PEZI|nr:hypothetical protein P8C59_006750 [Phyllachora maydis]
MASAAPPAPPAPAPPKKSRLPFKRVVRQVSPEPGSADKQGADDDDSLDFFRQSKTVFAEVIQEQEERLRQIEKTSSDAAPGLVQDKHDYKRRRVSLADSSEESDFVRASSRSPKKRPSAPLSLTSVTKESSISFDADDNDVLSIDTKGRGRDIDHPPTTPSRTPRSARSQRAVPIDDELDPVSPLQRARQNSEAWRSNRGSIPPVVKYEDDDDNDCFVLDKSPALDTDGAEGNKETDPPDEFDEFVKQARERRKKAKLEAEQAAAAKSAAGEGEGEPVVNILLTSQMSGAKPFMARLFLTWKGNKVFTTTTPRSLGVQVDADGWVKRHPGDDDSGYHKGGLVFEVWTDETYQDYLEEKERLMRQSRGETDDEAIEAMGSGEPEPEPPKKKKGIKVSLKAKDLEPVKLTVRRDTTIATMIDAFRAKTKQVLGPHAKISVFFDGEPTDEEAHVNDYDVELDDINQFEVHIK